MQVETFSSQGEEDLTNFLAKLFFRLPHLARYKNNEILDYVTILLL